LWSGYFASQKPSAQAAPAAAEAAGDADAAEVVPVLLLTTPPNNCPRLPSAESPTGTWSEGSVLLPEAMVSVPPSICWSLTTIDGSSLP